MLVKQRYAGWIGVMVGDVVVNAGISFKASCTAKAQLLEVRPNLVESAALLACMKENHPQAVEHISELERYLVRLKKLGKAHA